MTEDAGTGDIGMSEREEYLGDGLYASFDGYQIRLRAPRGFGVDHEVFLDQTTLRAFLGFIEHCRNESEKTPPRAKNRHGPSLAGGLFFCAP